MCWWKFGHCWHMDVTSWRKIRANKNTCNYSNPYVGFDKMGKYFMVRYSTACCKCGKTKYTTLKNHNMTDYDKHKFYGDDKDEMRGIF